LKDEITSLSEEEAKLKLLLLMKMHNNIDELKA
jgi:hypothetical protein